MKTAAEGYELFERVGGGEAYFNYYFLDSVAMCVFDGYEVGGLGGYTDRQKLHDLGAHNDLLKIASFEDFEALIARLKLELSVCE